MPSQRGQRGLNRAKGRFRRAGISLGSRHSTVDRPILFRKDPEDNAARKQKHKGGRKKGGAMWPSEHIRREVGYFEIMSYI